MEPQSPSLSVLRAHLSLLQILGTLLTLHYGTLGRYFCSFGRSSGSAISAKFSILAHTVSNTCAKLTFGGPSYDPRPLINRVDVEALREKIIPEGDTSRESPTLSYSIPLNKYIVIQSIN